MSEEQSQNIEQPQAAGAGDTFSIEINEKFLDNKLAEAVKSFRHKNFDLAETIFSDLMIQAVKYFKAEQHPHMAKFFFYYGDMLLSKLESNPDVFGEQAQKKETKVEGQEEPEIAQNEDVEKEGEAQVKENDENNEEKEVEGDNAAGEKDASDVEEEIVQLDKVIFKDENIEIRDETNEKGEVEEQEQNDTNLEAESQNKQEQADPIDDLQLAWEHLELSRKLYSQQLAHIQESSDEDKKTKAANITQQIIEISLRLGDLEQWRDNLSEAVKEFANALQLAQNIEDTQYSRNLSSIYFQLGNAQLYENKDFCEEEALKNFVESVQIMENCLSKKLLISPQEIPSFKVLKKEDLYIGHLKHSFLDDEESKEIKDTLKNLYEKIEDTLIQREDRDKFKVYQEKMKQQALHQNQFAQPSSSTAPIRNLGVLSMKRKEPQQDPPTQKENPTTTTEGTVANQDSSAVVNQSEETEIDSEKKLKKN